MSKKPLMLMILDGYGINENAEGNAVAIANTPNLDSIKANYPSSKISASGLDVGLPDGQMGNSEVGHTNIGAGRIVYQELTRITKSIEDGAFFENEALFAVMEKCKANDKALHIMGLLSDGGVHSHNTHLYGILLMAKKLGLSKVYVHAFMDGRDTPPTSGADYVAALGKEIEKIGVGKIATISGRYYAMDRDNRWERVEKAYNAMVFGQDNIVPWNEVMEKSYSAGISDEFVEPTACIKEGRISEGDGIIFFNFRPDRARQITRTFVDEDFSGFNRKYFPVNFVCFTQYDAKMPNVSVAFKPQSLENTLGEYLSKNGKSQLRIAETEKYAHVTFFFNGGVETVYENEDRALIASPKVATYDLKPEMSAFEVKDEVLKRIDSDKYDVIILNFANCDMVGHTGITEAAVKAVEAVDACCKEVADKVLSKGGALLITADHGNAEQMVDPENGEPFTAHTTNKVPLYALGLPGISLKDGRLADLAPTMLDILGLPKPSDMTGESLIIK